MSETNRRRFLQATGALAGVAGYSALSQALSPLVSKVTGPQAFQPPQAAEIDEVAHVLNRLTFGPAPGEHARITQLGAKAFIEEQLHPANLSDPVADRVVSDFTSLLPQPLGELMEYPEAQIMDELTRNKLLRATHSQRQLFEVMCDFWGDHFNIDPSKGDTRWLKPADEREVIRAHALGSFREMVKASALSPSMLWYLDGRVNKRRKPEDKPNENYARELLELHTLGVTGGYSQQDVMEVARCLTGWTVRERQKSAFAVGKVEFKAKEHDDGAKEVLGQRIEAGLGEKDLDRVIDIVALHPATGRYIATKLCRRFISEEAILPEPPTKIKAAIDDTAKAFLTSKGDISATLRTLFASEAFWTERGSKIKRPFHFVVSCFRAAGAQTSAGPEIQRYLERMGHAPGHYPTPDGYPEEPQPWMATLLWRWRFALEFSQGKVKGAKFDAKRLESAAGGFAPLAAHFLGRQAHGTELAAGEATPDRLALLMSAPAFQVF